MLLWWECPWNTKGKLCLDFMDNKACTFHVLAMKPSEKDGAVIYKDWKAGQKS